MAGYSNIALDILFNDLNAKIYLGMTHKNNDGMVNIFNKNNCKFKNVIVFNTKE